MSARSIRRWGFARSLSFPAVRGRPDSWRPRLEALEDRYAPTCSTAFLAGTGTLMTTCDGADDFYMLDRPSIPAGADYFVYANANPVFVQPVAPVTQIVVSTGGGNDSIMIMPSDATLSTLIDPLIVRGGTGAFDSLSLFDVLALTGQSYTFTSPYVQRPGMGQITYSGIEILELFAPFGENIFTVNSIRPGMTLRLSGESLDDTLYGPNTTATWALFGGGGFLDVLPTSRVEFLLMDTLYGGTADDTFQLCTCSDFMGFVSGGGGINELDYSPYASDAYVNLQLGTASGLSLGFSGIQNVTGGGGNDILVGDDESNVLIGNAGRNVLIGGGSGYSLQPDTLVGGMGEDLLIAGFTTYDTTSSSLLAIRDMWARTDLPHIRRIANLTNGTGAPLLNSSTVFSNYARSTVLGRGALDFFFGRRMSFADLTDWDSVTETFVEIL